MTDKTYSQRVARVFEILDYFMLVPAAIGALVGLALLFANPLYSFLLYGFLTVGIVLMVGYFKHSRGRLEEKYFNALWLTTAGYNFVLLLPFLYWASVIIQGGFKGYDGETEGGVIVGFLFLLGLIFGYLSAFICSIKAFTFERRKKLI
jgi:hypothetical protein